MTHEHEPPTPETVLSRIYYPPAPWLLRGSALAATFAVRAEAVAGLVPEPLKLVRVPFGLAMGYIGVARYSIGSTLEYSELVAGVVARYQNHIGPYVTHIGVNRSIAQRAGRELWYLPKQLWHFEWVFDQPETSVRIWDGVRLVCSISEAPLEATFWPFRNRLSFLNLRGTDVALIPGDFNLGLATLTCKLQIGPDGPLTPLKPVGPLVTVAAKGTVEVLPLQFFDQPEEPPASTAPDTSTDTTA
jgi:hypothetical protein